VAIAEEGSEAALISAALIARRPIAICGGPAHELDVFGSRGRKLCHAVARRPPFRARRKATGSGGPDKATRGHILVSVGRDGQNRRCSAPAGKKHAVIQVKKGGKILEPNRLRGQADFRPCVMGPHPGGELSSRDGRKTSRPPKTAGQAYPRQRTLGFEQGAAHLAPAKRIRRRLGGPGRGR